MGIGVNAEIAGKLRLLSPLGQGSVGQVWLARHLHLGSQVAVKFLNRDVSACATSRERFIREARTLARLRSPHVVQVHDFGFHQDRAYLVMEHLIGETLEQRLARLGALPPDQVVRVCTHVAKALQKAHDAGLIHRDIKPANVFLVDYGDEELAKVVDFGIVKSVGPGLSTSTVETLTQTGSVLGTPYYMSPEQIQDSGNVGYRADLWALGVIAYECLLGRRPFDAPNFPLLVMAICRDPIPVPSQLAPVPPAFDAWVERALQRDPAARFSSAKELARALCEALLFGSGAECISMPDHLVPPDLLWSGAYPGARLGSSHGSDRPFGPAGTTAPSDPARAAIPRAVLGGAVLPFAPGRGGDDAAGLRGSLDSHVATNSTWPAGIVRSNWARVPLVLAAAVGLLAAGWFASRHMHPTPAPELSSESVAAATSAVRPPAAEGPAPAASSATAIGPPAPPTAKEPAEVVSRRERRTAQPAEPAAPASTAPAAPPPKQVDPLEERQ